MYENELNLDVITWQECIDLHRLKGIYTVINDGKIVEFVEE